MEKQRRVVVYGNSLNMAGIAASLRADSSLEVLCVNPDSPDARQSLYEKDLAAIVFDLGDSPFRLDGSPFRLDDALVRDRPGLLLIGVGLEWVLLSSHPAQALSMADLVSVINHRECSSTSFHREKHQLNHQR